MNKVTLKKIVVALLYVSAIIGGLSAQVQGYDLWNGNVPGAIQSGEFKQQIDTTQGWVDKHSIVEPDLYFYPAPAEKARVTAVVICPGGGDSWGAKTMDKYTNPGNRLYQYEVILDYIN